MTWEVEMSKAVTTRAEYKALVEELAKGARVPDEAFEAMVAFAKAKKIKRPERPVAPAKREAGQKSARVLQRDLTCSVDGCESSAHCKGLCSKHHTAQWRAADPSRQERAREASRRWAARKRAEKLAAGNGETQPT